VYTICSGSPPRIFLINFNLDTFHLILDTFSVIDTCNLQKPFCDLHYVTKPGFILFFRLLLRLLLRPTAACRASQYGQELAHAQILLIILVHIDKLMTDCMKIFNARLYSLRIFVFIRRLSLIAADSRAA